MVSQGRDVWLYERWTQVNPMCQVRCQASGLLVFIFGLLVAGAEGSQKCVWYLVAAHGKLV